jgi:hypothetical protein
MAWFVVVGVLTGCGGEVAASRGEGLEVVVAGWFDPFAAGGRSSRGGARVSGAFGSEPFAAGGRSSRGGARAAGGVTSSGGAVVERDGGLPVCGIRESGTYLTESDCHPCLPRGTRCEAPPPLSGDQFGADSCIGFIEMKSTLYCVWYASREEYDQGWGAVIFCDSTPGIVACGGGI